MNRYLQARERAQRASRDRVSELDSVSEREWIAREVIRLRIAQMIVNEHNKEGAFKIPIHLALGHEAIAVSVAMMMESHDQLVLSHRNIHYNLARTALLKPIFDEYLLKEEGLGAGRLGSMNLENEQAGIVYASSILGNNLCVASGLALGQQVKASGGVVIVVTGDGAIEEGAFHESIEFMRSLHLSCLVIVENNEWSMATQIHARRCSLDLKEFARAFDAEWALLTGNDPINYVEALRSYRARAIAERKPLIVEVSLKTLGDWYVEAEGYPAGKYINYHAGPAPKVGLTATWPVLREDSRDDPLCVLETLFDKERLEIMASDLLNELHEEIA